MLVFCSGLYRHKRIAATHILAILISPEARNRKPYALPVQMIPYIGLNRSEIRDIINNVISEMSMRGMSVSGKSMLWQILCNQYSCIATFNMIVCFGITVYGL